MITAIDRSGRLVVPKPIREAMGLTSGTALEIRVADGRIEIEPTSIAVRFERRDSVMVAVSEQSVSLLKKEEVEKTLLLLRNDRVV